MLDRISIENFATIEHLEFDLGKELNIITGETGAGKSVLVQAISTALGGRADISMVRTSCEKAVIQVTGTKDGEDIIISRELLSGGKSISKLNGEIISLNQLKDFCAGFVDIHGQYDNQQILDPENHISITDAYADAAFLNEVSKLSELYKEYSSLRSSYNKLLRDESESLRQQEFYRFEADNIEKLDLKSGEEEELSNELSLMRNSEKIYQAVNSSYALLHEKDDSVLSMLSQCVNEISAISSFSEELSALGTDVSESYYTLESVSEALRDISGKLSFSAEDLDRVQSRLSAIEEAKRKYHMNVEEIISYGEELREKLKIIDNFDVEKEKKERELKLCYESLSNQAELVSELRKKSAKKLEKAIETELAELEFSNSEFRIDIEKLDEIGEKGFDKVEFLISTNPGEPLRPLTKIASGGEISRIMLAFKRTIGDGDKLDTMIFDEIDTGISGKTALVVGKKLKEIAEHHQVICITHLPQIASFGDDNFQIVKSLSDGKSSTSIEHLDEEGKVRQIANLISGDATSESSLSAARELIKNRQ